MLRGVLCVLAISDIIHAKREQLSGPIWFMTWDNFRHYVFLVLICVFVRNGENTYAFYTIIADVIFGFYRRRRMALLVGEYLHLTMPGGKRWIDKKARGAKE